MTVTRANHREIFSHTSDSIGLKVIRIKRGRYKDTDAKCFALFYYAGSPVVFYQYVVGRCYADQFHPDSVKIRSAFQDTQPYWLTPYHRARVRVLLARFYELVAANPAALRIMGLAAFMKLEKLARKRARR